MNETEENIMKKFTSVLLAVAMVATMLVGCGAKEEASAEHIY